MFSGIKFRRNGSDQKPIVSLPSEYQALLEFLSADSFSASCSDIEQYLTDYWNNLKHGDFPRWQAAIDEILGLRDHSQTGWQVEDDFLSLAPNGFPESNHQQLEQALRQLMPWRKGPVGIGPVNIDTEWRSDWKWQRLLPHLDWQGMRILDIGAGNGYYGYRMLNAGAEAVIGVDPTLLSVMQSRLMQHCAGQPANWVLPMTLEQVPENLSGFDVVLSLGVLYHRKDPVEHLQKLRQCLKPGGRVVVETFVIPPGMGDSIEVDRYARMRNVYQIPSVGLLREWMEQAGWRDIHMVDLCRTSVSEQRSTDWMRFESLAESLDKEDNKLTVEGGPAPVRMVCVANKAE